MIIKNIDKWCHDHKRYLGKWFWQNKDCWRSRLLILLIASESCKYDKGGWGFSFDMWKYTAKISEEEALKKACKIYNIDFKQFEFVRKKTRQLPWRDHRW